MSSSCRVPAEKVETKDQVSQKPASLQDQGNPKPGP